MATLYFFANILLIFTFGNHDVVYGQTCATNTAVEGSKGHVIKCSCDETSQYKQEGIRTAADCDVSEGKYWRASDALVISIECGRFIGWVCPTGNAHTELCWKDHMEVYGNNSLIIKTVETRHAGVYECKQTENLNPAIELIVTAIPHTASLVGDPPPNTAIAVNTTLTLTCTATGYNNYPNIIIKQSSARCSTEIIHSSDDQHTLQVLHSLQKCHNGESFICETDGDDFTRTSSIGRYDVTFPPTQLITEAKDMIKEDTVEVFACSSDSSNPVSTITWEMVTDVTHQATESEKDGEHKGHEVTSSLPLTVTKEMNGHQLKCELWYKNTKQRSHTYTLTVSFDPTFLTLEEDPPFGQQDEGVQKTITCHTDSANPPVIIKWTSDISGDLDAVTTLGSGENGGQTASSVVNRELSKSMNGERITCEAAHGSNVVENLAQSTTLHVKFPSTELNLVPSSEAHEGEEATIKCTAGEANPTSRIKWYRNNAHITAENIEEKNIEGIYNGYIRESILTWTATKQDNGVTYSCEVEGSNLQESHKMSVTFHPTYLTLKEDPPGQQDEGAEKKLTCTTDSANPPVNIKWTTDISGISADTTHGGGLHGGQTAHSEVTLELSKEINGEEVTCKAIDEKDNVIIDENEDSTISLNVKFASTSLSLEPSSLHSEEGDKVSLTCRADEANPTSQITWYRGSDHVAENVEDTITPGEYNSDISISTLTWTARREDNGLTYICSVAEGNNPLQENHKMIIYFPPLDITYQSKEGMTPEGTTEVFECSSSSSSNPVATISWIMSTGDGEHDVTGQAVEVTLDGDNSGYNVKSELFINVTKDSQGQTLTCSLIYEDDVAKSHTYFIVVSYPNEVQIEGSEFTQVEETTLDLTCSSSGGNPPTSQYTWSFHASYDVISDTPCEDEHSAICSISSLSYTHTGRYTCTASNKWGGEEPSDDVNVQVTYSPKAAMDDVEPERSFTSGSNETLTCTFYSNPAVESVTWYDGPDDQGELILTDLLEPRLADKYISTLFLKDIMHNKTVTCVALQVDHNRRETRKITDIAAENTYTFYIHIINEEGSTSSGVAAGLIAGVVVGMLVAVVAGAALVWIVKKKRMLNSDADTPVLRPDATQRLENDFSPETSEDNVGIYENRAYGTEALYANMDRSERPEPTMEPERIHVDDLHALLPNIEGLIYTELAIPRFITPKKNVIVDPPTDYATIVDIRAMFPERFPAKPDVPTKPEPPARRAPRPTAPKAHTDEGE